MKKIFFSFFLLLSFCSRKSRVIDCKNDFINEYKVVEVIDTFFVEDIKLKDTINFNYSGTDSFYRTLGPYLLRKSDIENNFTYHNGVYLNHSLINKIKDFNYSIDKSINNIIISNKLDSLKQSKKYYFEKHLLYNFSNPACFRYSKHRFKLKYVFIGYGCVYIPDFSMKYKVHFKEIKIPLNLILDLEEI